MNLLFTPTDQRSANLFAQMIRENEYHYEWNPIEGYFTMPCYMGGDPDCLEEQLTDLMGQREWCEINGYFEAE